MTTIRPPLSIFGLARTGLAASQSVELGHVLGGRPIRLWSLTDQGRQRLPDQPRPWGGPVTAVAAYGLRSGPPARPRPTELPLLVSTYRLLAALVAEQPTPQQVRVLAWEHRWRRTWLPSGPPRQRPLAVELPGGADVAPLVAAMIPEPSGVIMLSIGLGGLIAFRWRHSRARA